MMIRRLGIAANCTKPDAPVVLKKLAVKAKKLGIQIVTDKASLAFLKCGKALHPKVGYGGMDAVMALGGDGTMLRAVRMLEGRDIPVIGLNIGALGFLTSIVEDELDRALKCLVSGQYHISVRAMLEATVERKGMLLTKQRALNDVVVSSGPSNRVVVLALAIDGDRVTDYVCDGLIVSTPTGSTGHSLSAGGPILTPQTQAFVISLICPHTLSSRPLVVPDKSEIMVNVAGASGKILFSVDGQIAQSLAKGDVIKVRRSEKSVRFIHLPNHSYFNVLRKKLHWSGSNV